MKKLFSMIAAVLFAGSMFAADVTVDLAKGSHNGSSITWSAVDGNITVQQLKGTATTAVNANYISAPRVYKGHILAFTCKENYTITGIEITCNGTYYGNSMTAGTAVASDVVTDDATNILRTWASTSGGTHVVSTKNADGESAIYIQNVASESNVQLRFTALKISYIKAAATTPTISAGDVDFGTVISGKAEAATLNVTGENLTSAITYSLQSGANFSVTGELTTTGGKLTVNVTNNAEGEYEDVLTLVSGTDATKQVTITANVVELTGEGSETNPYTCADVLKLHNAISDKAWVKGYILGGAKTAGNPSELVVEALSGTNTAMAIADAATETDNTKMVTVQLGADVRADVAAAGNEGKLIQVQGTLEAYLTVPGVKGVSSTDNYKFIDTPTPPTPTPGDTVKLVYTAAEGLEWGDYTATEGYWDCYVNGVFELSNVYSTTAAGTYAFADLDPDYCYVVSGSDTIYFAKGDGVVVAVDGDIVTLKGNLTGTDDVVYAFDLSYDPSQVDPYSYDEDQDFTATFSSYSVKEVSDGEFSIMAVSDGKGVVMTAFLPTGATAGQAAGKTFPINDSGDEQTVAAGYYDGTDGIMPSYAALVNTSYQITNVWYLVSGTATVDANLNITVAAKNSKGRNINIQLNYPSTGIQDVKTVEKLVKYIQNGQIMINVNGAQYNVNGARVK